MFVRRKKTKRRTLHQRGGGPKLYLSSSQLSLFHVKHVGDTKNSAINSQYSEHIFGFQLTYSLDKVLALPFQMGKK
jgi:hypothetical protein